MTKLFDEDPLAGSVLRTVRVLGSSADNTVVLASNSFTGQLVAVKLISRGFDSPRAKYLLRELLNHYELTLAKHPHIVRYAVSVAHAQAGAFALVGGGQIASWRGGECAAEARWGRVGAVR